MFNFNDRLQVKFFVFVVFFILFLPSCGPTYPKEKLLNSVQKLFKKELHFDVHTKLMGKTLYVGIEMENVLDKDFQFSPKVVEQLESAMISISRIGLSTDAPIDFTVIDLRDQTYKVKVEVMRKMQDLRDLFYWRISKPDFDSRLVVNINKEYRFNSISKSTPSALWNEWQEITIEDFMTHLLAARLTAMVRSNLLLSIVLGFDKVQASYDRKSGKIILDVGNFYLKKGEVSSTDSDYRMIENSVQKFAREIFLKYFNEENLNSHDSSTLWGNQIVVQDSLGKDLILLSKADWVDVQTFSNEKNDSIVLKTRQ